MARTRLIHPDFFTDADLLSLTPLHRLLFAGLWCHADREGRLLDKPRDLKIRILPGDQCDVEPMLADLAGLGMVTRYEAGGVRVLSLPGFVRRQHPHAKEAASTLPDMVEPGNYPASPVKVVASRAVSDTVSASDTVSDTVAVSASVTESHSPPKHLSDADAFFARIQDMRAEAGDPRERPPHPAKLGAWYSEALGETGGDEARLLEAYFAFSRDKFWQDKTPPVPFGGFMSQWQRFLPGENPTPSIAVRL
jgi:hypothetical protein